MSDSPARPAQEADAALSSDMVPGDVAAAEPPPQSISTISISVRGGCFATEDEARTFANTLAAIVCEISRYVDMRTIDGVTVGVDYAQALAELDRGREELRPLTHSTEENDGVIGAAMAPSVLRDGKVKTHLLFNFGLVAGLGAEDMKSEEWQFALHAVAHESAHVEVTAALDHAFPGIILQEQISDHLRARRIEVINAAWDEYGATRISAAFGLDPTPGYLEIFLSSVRAARQNAHDAITAYRTHGDLDQVMTEVILAYGNLIKFSAYLLGTLDGLARAPEDLPELVDALRGHWFYDRFKRLHGTFQDLWGRWGKWESRDEFEPIADIFIEIAEEGGFFMVGQADGTMRIDIPFRPENTPFHPLWAPFGRRMST